VILESLELEETRTELRSLLESLYERSAPIGSAVARADLVASGDVEPPVWARLAEDVGAVGLAVPTGLGGSGAGLAELAVLFEMEGAGLGCVPLLGSVLALEVLLRGDESARRRWVPDLATGSVRGALAWRADAVTAVRTGEETVLDGVLAAVTDVVGAGVLVLPVGEDLYLVDLSDEQVQVEQLATLDLTRSAGRVRLAGVRAVWVGAVATLDEVRDVAALLLAHELLGVAERALGDAVAYAGAREQFGRVIGSFQALKHLLADMATSADLARSLVEHAAWAAAEAPERLRETATMAYLAAADSACFVTAENVQVHGGIGFSWEHPAHLYFRKARADAALLGERSDFVDRLLETAGVSVGDGR